MKIKIQSQIETREVEMDYSLDYPVATLFRLGTGYWVPGVKQSFLTQGSWMAPDEPVSTSSRDHFYTAISKFWYSYYWLDNKHIREMRNQSGQNNSADF